jgi:ferredoxin
VDVLRLPVAGALFRWRYLRLALQLTLLAIAVAIVLHGLLGPQIAPRNLSTVLTAIHWRGFLVIGIVAAGNLFCAACPMILVRDAGRRVAAPRFSWPRALRRKWIALGLLILALFSYELFDLWELPRATAWVVLGYFGLALAIDLLFKGASFCKYVCPVGQFNFVASTMAPLELRVRDVGTCRGCRTSDCIRGQRAVAAPLQIVKRGCELGLFLPSKAGNLDCTLCLDCVRACPHDNIALAARVPGVELLDLRRRSGIGRLAERSDLAALAVVFTFGALLTAFAMTPLAVAAAGELARVLRLTSEGLVLTVLFVIALGMLPAALLACAAAATRAGAGDSTLPLVRTARRYASALIPLALGVWLAHYGFHLLTGVLTVIPVTQSAVADLLGWAALGEPAWQWAGMAPPSVYPAQVGFVVLGACGSIGLAHAMSLRDYPDRANAASASWLVAIVALAAAAVWIFNQPMDMRGLGGTG